ncbi:hypothetical protein EGX06_09110 [Enterococcus hirae]|nr:hypothetical protein EGX06_09110 [Enterococcus hirae]
MFLWLKTLYRKRAVTWPFIFYTIIWTLSLKTGILLFIKSVYISFFAFYFQNKRYLLLFFYFFGNAKSFHVVKNMNMIN